MNKEISELQEVLRQFAKERDWEQFHSPKNLASALSVEAAELLEHFQWLSDEQSRNLSDTTRTKVGEEIADVFLYLLQLSDKLGVDLINAGQAKIHTNASRYPIELSKGSSSKYTEL
jgi:dCTP diphosphatase